MSGYPSRPPMGMPPPPMGMPPPMGNYGYPPPMGYPPGMMPPPMMRMRHTSPSSSSSSSSSSVTIEKKPDTYKGQMVPQEIPKADKPPLTTVFVGSISDRAPDPMIRTMLQRCGNVISWKRIQGASGKLQAFGFCEYEEPEATLRCMRLLNDWKIGDQKLILKVDEKTQSLLDEYKKAKRAKARAIKKANQMTEENKAKMGLGEVRNGREDGEDSSEDDEHAEEVLDEFTQREDRVAKAGLDAIMREYATELDKDPTPELEIREKKREEQPQLREGPKITQGDVTRDQGLDDMELGEDEKDMINREINRFRDSTKKEDSSGSEDRDRERRRRRAEEEREAREAREKRRREREDPEVDRRKEKERELMRDFEREARRKEEAEAAAASRAAARRRENPLEMEDEHERRRVERRLKEKEHAYQERLKKWELRERQKERDYDKEMEKDTDRKSEEAKESRRMKEFLEDYDDERDDSKYYKSSSLQRRLREREKEMELDERDRQREKEEIEEVRRRLLEEGHPDPEAQIVKLEREQNEHLIPRLGRSPSPVKERTPEHRKQPQRPDARVQPAPEYDQLQAGYDQGDYIHQSRAELHQKQQTEPARRRSGEERAFREQPAPPPQERRPEQRGENGHGKPERPERPEARREDSLSQERSVSQERRPQNLDDRIRQSSQSQESSPSLSNEPQKRKLTVKDVFNTDDDEVDKGPKKRKLVPLDYSEEEERAVKGKDSAEEKRKSIKALIEQIPTTKADLFAYKLDWTQVDKTLLERRIKPWVNKKIYEYIDAEEPTLTEFICQKVMAHSTAETILNDVAMVLDEEAEVFVVKMWRLLIYETEAKKAGLVK